ncbi:MAG: Asp-tRNA(Asn)/Glu-tRNA(Gln) amidotransferase subunit GatC [Cyanobacteria bacterium LVE1205-1]|jgi:aspartyl-tRNA(Asn)/glutamyl-tRNA(Gln) amidotransferase subunit C
MLKPEEVRKVASLARLELTPDEEGQFATQLSDILTYIEQLNQLDTTDVLPTTRAIDGSNITREDHLTPYANPRLILEGAPEPEGEFFRVPKIGGE